MKLALVFNPFSYVIHEENLRIVQRFFGLFPPLSLAWVASIAESHGHEVIIVDARTLGLSMHETVKILEDFKPDILGFTITSYVYQETLSWIRYIKREIPRPVIVGGYGVGLYPIETIMPEEINFGVIGHAYDTLPKLLTELETGRNFSNVPGLAYKDNGGVKLTPKVKLPADFDSFPNPARHLLPNELYAAFPSQRKNFTVMITSMGCPHRCIFCEIARSPYFSRSARMVLNEIEESYYNYAIREIEFFDYEFTANRQRVIDICNGIIDRKLDILWACRSRVDSVDKKLLKKMKEAGCERMYYGMESGVQEILDVMKKGITLDQIRETVRLTKEVGIKPLGFFMIGNPGETRDTVKKTIQFTKSLHLDYVQFGKLTAKPLTPIYRELVEQTGNDYWRDYVLGKTEEKVLPRPWTTLTNREIDILSKKAYVSFHTRFLFLLKSVLKTRSFYELRRKILAYLEMVFCQEGVSKKAKHFEIYRGNKVSRISRMIKFKK